MLKRIVIFLIRKRLGLKKHEYFMFVNQKSNDLYYFTDTNVMKCGWWGSRPSSVSLNWLLDDECEIRSMAL